MSLPDPDEELAQGFRTSGMLTTSPAGRLRLSFHLWNIPDDVHDAVTLTRAEWYRRLFSAAGNILP